jgi:hypothetical protein
LISAGESGTVVSAAPQDGHFSAPGAGRRTEHHGQWVIGSLIDSAMCAL